MDKGEKTFTVQKSSSTVPRLLVHNYSDKGKLSSNIGPVVVVSNNKRNKQICVNTIGLSNADINMKSLLQNLSSSSTLDRVELDRNKVYAREISLHERHVITSTSPKPAVQKSDSDQHNLSDNIVHVEISESEHADNIGEQNQVSRTTDGEEKSGIILFKWGGSSKKPLHCQICDMAFSDGELLRKHLSKHESTRPQQLKPFPCRLCYKSFLTERSLERHQFVHSGQTMKRCKFCYKVFANKENLDKHLLMHNGQKMHRCPICEERFAYRQGLETHLLTHSKEKNFHCSFCSKAFSRKDTMERHQMTHCSLKEKSHKCVECGKSFSFLFTLRKHVRSVHGGESDGKECEICGKFIKNRENVSRHMMIHADKRPYKCNECDRAFVQKQHLKDHMAIHSSTSSNICKICCNIFRHRRSLNRHLRKHYSIPSKGVYACSKCNEQFDCEIKVREHILNLHERIVFCSMCKSKFQEENELAAHMLKEHSIVFKDGDMPELVNKSTETNEADVIDGAHVEKATNDTIEQEAAEDLLRIQNVQCLSSDRIVTMSLVSEESKTNDVHSTVEASGVFEQATSPSNTLNSECSENVLNTDNEVDMNLDSNSVIYIVCNESQAVDEGSSQHIINISDFQQEIVGNRNNVKRSNIQAIYIPETINQSGSQIIHIPETMNQNGSQIIHIPESMNQTGSQITNTQETASQSSVNTKCEIEHGNERMEEDMENSLVDNELSVNIEKNSNDKSENHIFTDQTHYESDRSALIQSLIDYAEKIQEEKMLGEDSSETRI